MSTYDLSLLYSRSPLAPAAPAPGDRYVITLKAVLNESPCHHNMNCRDHLSEQLFRAVGGYFANFSSSVGSISEEIYSQQAVYLSYTHIMRLLYIVKNRLQQAWQ